MFFVFLYYLYGHISQGGDIEPYGHWEYQNTICNYLDRNILDEMVSYWIYVFNFFKKKKFSSSSQLFFIVRWKILSTLNIKFIREILPKDINTKLTS